MARRIAGREPLPGDPAVGAAEDAFLGAGKQDPVAIIRGRGNHALGTQRVEAGQPAPRLEVVIGREQHARVAARHQRVARTPERAGRDRVEWQRRRIGIPLPRASLAERDVQPALRGRVDVVARQRKPVDRGRNVLGNGVRHVNVTLRHEADDALVGSQEHSRVVQRQEVSDRRRARIVDLGPRPPASRRAQDARRAGLPDRDKKSVVGVEVAAERDGGDCARVDARPGVAAVGGAIEAGLPAGR